MIGETLRIAGSSVCATTVANFFGFYVGTFVSLKDVQIFSKCGMIIEMVNFMVILIGFTSILTLTAKRTEDGYKDCSFCCCFMEKCKVDDDKIISQKPLASRAPASDWFFKCLSKTAVRVVLTLVFFALVLVGVYGSTLIKTGLPLAELMPTGSYAQKYLSVREKLYFNYIVDLYTDANEDRLTPIDWNNKFEEFILQTKGNGEGVTNENGTINDIRTGIYSIDNNQNNNGRVSEDIDLHEFWAWDMQEYLQEKYNDVHGSYTPMDMSIDALKIVLANEEVRKGTYKAINCEIFRQQLCASFVDTPLFKFQGKAYNCLRANQDKITDPNCINYLDSLIETQNSNNIAKQIEIVSSSDESITGLYVTNNDNENNVFYNTITNYILFQRRSDNSWLLLDNNYNLIYIGDATIDAIPPTNIGSWKSINNPNTIQEITTTYWNTTYVNFRRDPNLFTTNDVSNMNNFFVEHNYIPNDVNNNTQSQYKFELFQLVLENVPSYIDIKLSSNIGPDIQCNSILSATELCRSIVSNDNLGAIDCQKFATDTKAKETSFWVGHCDNEYTIVAVNGSTLSNSDSFDFDSNITCNNCEANGALSSKTFNYMIPNGNNNFGGFEIDLAGNQCHDVEQTMKLECEPLISCQTLGSCVDDYITLHNNPNVDASICALDKMVSFLDNTLLANGLGNRTIEFFQGYDTQIARCLLEYYDLIPSDCCRQAIDYNIIDGLIVERRRYGSGHSDVKSTCIYM